MTTPETHSPAARYLQIVYSAARGDFSTPLVELHDVLDATGRTLDDLRDEIRAAIDARTRKRLDAIAAAALETADERQQAALEAEWARAGEWRPE